MTTTGKRLRNSVPEISTADSHPAGIKALGPDGLERLFSSLGQPSYRVGQLTRWLYGRGVTDWSQMSDLPVALRDRLASAYPLVTPELERKQISALDGTRKYLWRLGDGVTVESVGLPSGDRLTVCFSTQAGCAMGCTFCATGASGLTRDLSPGEMVDQVRLVGADFQLRVTNAVAMGQGEPFAVYDSTLGALRLMNSPDGLGVGARHLTVSTCGIISGISRLANEPEQFTLAVSLHSATQSTRDVLMPGVRGMGLDRLRGAVEDYVSRTGRRVTFEYALIGGVNDTDLEISALVEYCRGLLCHVNLIPVNPIGTAPLDRSSSARAREIAQALGTAGTEATVRTERGTDIDAACGQLRQHAEGEAKGV